MLHLHRTVMSQGDGLAPDQERLRHHAAADTLHDLEEFIWLKHMKGWVSVAKDIVDLKSMKRVVGNGDLSLSFTAVRQKAETVHARELK